MIEALKARLAPSSFCPPVSANDVLAIGIFSLTATIPFAQSQHPALPALFDWTQAEAHVLKLQRKIAVAYTAGNTKKVKELQGILVNSYAARMLAARRVVTSTGKSPGVDNKTVNTRPAFYAMVSGLKEVTSSPSSYVPSPVRRVMIPKGYGSNEKRPLGIPTVFDKAVQALYMMALLPIAEITADKGSYGYRKGMGSLDAAFAVKKGLVRSPRPEVIFDADIAKFFDTVSHDWLLTNIPMDRRILGAILSAGVIIDGKFAPTVRGFPQGAVISPVLGNMSLDGLEKAIHDSVKTFSRFAKSVQFVRYADDFVVLGLDKSFVWNSHVIPAIVEFLKLRGLELSQTKSKLVTKTEGFDFLGYNFKWVENNYRAGPLWLRLSPSKKSHDSLLLRIDDLFVEYNDLVMRAKLIQSLNALLQGWGNYHKYGHSSVLFAKVDNLIWEKYLALARNWYPTMKINEIYPKVFEKSGKVKFSPFYVTFKKGGKPVSNYLKRLSDVKILSLETPAPRSPTGEFGDPIDHA